MNHSACCFKKILAVVALLLLPTLANGQNYGEYVPTIPSVKITEKDFGMQKLFRYSNGSWTYRWPTEPYGLVRLWDTGTKWLDIEPQNDQWSWFIMDQYINTARSKNPKVQFVYTLGMTPSWASARPTETAYYAPGAAAEPNNIGDWIDYVTTVATRYQGKIMYYEIWNEPYYYMFWSGGTAKMVEMAQAAYTALKAVDPNIQVLSPTCTNTYLSSYLNAGGGNYMDMVASHFYCPSSGPETGFPETIQGVREVMYNHNLDIPLWNTEGAVKNEASSYPSSTSVLTGTEAYKHIIRWYIVNRTEGVETTAYYGWDHTYYGLVDYPDRDSKDYCGPAIGRAYDWLIDRTIISKTITSSGTWGVGLNRGGNTIDDMIVWNPGGPTTFDVSSASMNTMMDIYGNTTDISGQSSINISDSPVYLTHSPACLHGDEPRLYLPMNDCQSNMTSDLSGYDTDGTVVGANLTTSGMVHGAMNFDGPSGGTKYIHFNNNSDLKVDCDMSISMWVYARSAPDTQGRTAASTYYWSSGQQTKGWNLGALWSGTNSLSFSIHAGGISYNTSDSTFFDSANLNKWRHVVAVYKPSRYVRLYVDNVLVSENTTNIPDSIDYHPNYGLVIGQRSYGGQSRWDGYIDEFRLHRYTLTDREIDRLYRSGNQVLCMSFDNINNGIIRDESLYNCSGTASTNPPPSFSLVRLQQNPLTYSAIGGKSAEFSGTSYQAQNITFGNNPALKISGPMSISAWVYARSGPASEGRTAASTYYWASGQQAKGWNLGASWTTPSFSFSICSGGTSYGVSDTNFFNSSNLSKWRHVVAVYKPSTYVRLYIDNVLVAENTSNIPASIDYHSDYGLVIGERSYGGQSPWNGYIDELEMYNRVLTTTEINRLYEKYR